MTPPPPPPRKPRHQSQTERDLEGMAARRERESASPPYVFDDLTGRYQGEELREQRSKRPTDKRVERLEEKHDSLDKVVDEIRGDVREIKGQMKGLPDLVDLLKTALAAKRDDDHAVLEQQLEVGAHEAKARIDTQQVATKSKWNMAVQVVGGLFSAGVLGAVIALAASRC